MTEALDMRRVGRGGFADHGGSKARGVNSSGRKIEFIFDQAMKGSKSRHCADGITAGTRVGD